MELDQQSIRKYIDHPTPFLTAKLTPSCYCSASGRGAGIEGPKLEEI